MVGSLPSLIVTGASGFVGRHLLEAARDSFQIFALCRRSQRESGLPDHPNIKWIQVDIGDWAALKTVMGHVKELGGADYLVHLAAYYDFRYSDSPEYEHTNVNGTRHMLEQAKWLCIRHCVFASSLAACKFPAPGDVTSEQSLADAEFAYARSKKLGEDMMREYSRWFTCSTVRLAAAFSDWCEYPPLYVFLSTWLSKKWNARILGGHGESAITYIHVNDLVRFLLKLLYMTNALPAHGVYIASPDAPVSHRELFETATRYHFGSSSRPVFMPKGLASAGIVMRDVLGRVTGTRPFERPWMIQYIDRKLLVDASHTRSVLEWEPSSRHLIRRRLLFMIEKMKSNRGEWQMKNEAAMKRRQDHPNLRIASTLLNEREKLVARIVDAIRSSAGPAHLPHYGQMEMSELEWYIGIVYRILMAAVRTGDRTLVLQYASDLAGRRYEEGFSVDEMRSVLALMNRLVIEDLLSHEELRSLAQEVHDSVTMTIDLTIDEIEDCYERLAMQPRPEPTSVATVEKTTRMAEDLEEAIRQLDVFYVPMEPHDREGKADSEGRDG